MNTDYSEDMLLEQPTIELLSELEYETANCFYVRAGTSLTSLVAERRQLIQSARRGVASEVDTLQVLTNFEIGRRIVE